MPISSAVAVGNGTTGTGATPPEQSASCIVAKTATGSHTLTFDGYSRIKKASRLSFPCWITSSTFSVGGHSWSAEFTYHRDFQGFGAWIVMLLQLRCGDHCSAGERVQARYKFSVLDHNGQPSYSASSDEVYTFTAARPCGDQTNKTCRLLAEPRTTPYLRGDCLKVRCDVIVYKELRTEDRDVPTRLVAVPPSDMGEQLGRLLSSGVGADLTFEVTGETFAVHRYILAVRSPVLLDEIVSGCLMKKRTTTDAVASCGIEINGVEARVFKALLYYIYTDSLPPEIAEDDTMDMARHLIAAANRYGLDRLKLICEDMLCRRVDTGSVADTLAVAEQYNCHGLKKACVQFLVSGSNLKAAMAAGGFERLRSSCPSVLKDLLAMVVR